MDVDEEEALSIVPFPLNNDHVPIPIEGLLAEIDVVEAHIIWLFPTIA
jgi:hypothetical protein